MIKIIHFLKYNNAAIFIVLGFFLLASGVFAQTEAGQNLIGQKQTSIKGVDNTLLIEADLTAFNMDFKIEKIETDDNYYYLTYTYLDLVKKEDAWQYEMREKVRKISKSIPKDLGSFMAEELSEQNTARIAELKNAQAEAQGIGGQARVELTEYNGLIGKSLELASKIFPDYEPVKKVELPHPSIPDLFTLKDPELGVVAADNLTNIYNEYLARVDVDNDEILGDDDNCPLDNNPDQIDSDNNGVGDACENEYDLETIETPLLDTKTNEITGTEDISVGNKNELDNKTEDTITDSAIKEEPTNPIDEKEVEIISISQ